jgi:predicted nucleic acid-binding protein
MYLVDTNVWLEHLLAQKQAETVRKFLNTIPSEYLLSRIFPSILLQLYYAN